MTRTRENSYFVRVLGSSVPVICLRRSTAGAGSGSSALRVRRTGFTGSVSRVGLTAFSSGS